MNTNTEALPEPAIHQERWLYNTDGEIYGRDTDLIGYTAAQMHAHAAKLCAAKDAEIGLLNGTLDSRNRNIDAMRAEIERLKDKAATVGYWFSAYGRATDEIERLRASAQQALEALKFAYNDCESPFIQDEKIDPAIITLTAALESKND